MRDRTVRRRRATLAALVIASLVLLTAYFGESASGGLHALQRGVVDVVSPIQEGANRALKPVRDLVGWVGDTFDAQHERDKLRAERDQLRKQLAELDQDREENDQLRALVKLDKATVDQYSPVTTRVISRNHSVWYSTLVINKGSSDGVRVDQPVIGEGALVGKVASVGSGTATVKLITDEGFGVAAKSAPGGEPGIIEPSVGDTGTLLFELVDGAENVRVNDRVYTSGLRSDAGEQLSLYPPGIPIGRVSSVDEGEGPLTREIKVKPAADLRRMNLVQVLTQPRASDAQQARVTP